MGYNLRMIARLSGRLVKKETNQVIVDVGGVGYQVVIPLSTYYELGEQGADVSLRIYTHVREDVLSLYGFRTAKEKRLFTLLIQISGIGPKLATTILSGLPADDLAAAVVEGNLVRLNSIPGVGKKTAERIILELSNELAKLWPSQRSSDDSVKGSLQVDVVSALVNLGYSRKLAERSVSRAIAEEGSNQFESLLKAALRRITG